MDNISESIRKLKRSLFLNEDLEDNMKFLDNLNSQFSQKVVAVRGVGTLGPLYNLKVGKYSTDRECQAVVNMVNEIIEHIEQTMLDDAFAGRVLYNKNLEDSNVEKRREFLALYILHYIMDRSDLGNPKYSESTVLANKEFAETTIILDTGDKVLVSTNNPSFRTNNIITYYNDDYNFKFKTDFNDKRYDALANEAQKILNNHNETVRALPFSPLLYHSSSNIVNQRMKNAFEGYTDFLEALIIYAQNQHNFLIKTDKPKTND